MIRVVNSEGRAFLVRVVHEGDHYGLNDCLITHDGEPMIEFYDATYAGDSRFGPRGQFVSRYYLDTLERHGENVGLNLQGDVDVWHVSAENVQDAIKWTKEQLNQ